jgi:hypothetical protein
MPKSSFDAARTGKRALAITATAALAVAGAAFGSAAVANADATPPAAVTVTPSLTSSDAWALAVDNTNYDYAFENGKLRFSNWVNDPNYADTSNDNPEVKYGAISQVTTPTTPDVGEAVTGADYNTFTENFTVDAATYAQQPGLAIEVDASKGGNRNGGNLLLREDVAGQLTVSNFYNDGSTDELSGWHNHTAQVPFSGPIAISLVDHFVAGDDNDIVDVYANGNLLFTSTTWENFTAEDNDGAKQAVNSIVFRTGYRQAVDGGAWVNAEPTPDQLDALKGNGFEFSNVSLTASNPVTAPTATTTKKIQSTDIGVEGDTYPTNDLFIGKPNNPDTEHPGITGVTDGALGLAANTQVLHGFPSDSRPTDLGAFIDSGLTWNQAGTSSDGVFFQIPVGFGDGHFTTLRPADVTSGANTAQYDQQWVSSSSLIPSGTLSQIVSELNTAGNVSIFGYGVFANAASSVTSFQAGDTKYTFANDPSITVSNVTITKNDGAAVGTPAVGDVLTANYDASITTGTPTYQWYAGSTAISGATGATYTVTSNRHGETLKVKVTVSKVGSTKGSGVSAVTPKVVNGTFTEAGVSIAGNGSVGDTLSAIVGSAVAPTSIAYQWYRDGAAISKATKSTYTLTSNDLGHVIKVHAKLSKTGYNTLSVASTDSVTVEVGEISLSPTLSGTAQVGKTLTVKSGSATPGKTLFITWYLDNGDTLTALQASSKTTLKIPAKAVGGTIFAQVLAYAPGYEPNEDETDDSAVITN